ncbi:MAG: PTS sugar transporter subunit IIA [Candidatus Omnitrophica bacterium]|nr:PTS sugar transporter subunit IIA [Candidatus Omnitrophota bacterium]
MELTFHDIETAFGVDESMVYHWLNAQKMPALKAQSQYFFNSVEVLEWALKNRIPLTPGALKLCEKKRNGLDVLTPALGRGGVYRNISGRTREAVLSQVIDLLPLPEAAPRSLLKEMLLSREQIGTTAIGKGIAIPHVKHPVVLSGIEPLVGAFFLENEVDFAAFDKQNISILFVILSASFKEHLALLSRLAFCLQNPLVSAALEQRLVDAQELRAVFQVAESKIE